MTTINMDPDGNVTISAGGPDGPSPEIVRDSIAEISFKEGFDAAVRETMAWFVQGRLPEFYNSVGLKTDNDDPHRNEPEGMGEDIDWSGPGVVTIDVDPRLGADLIRRAQSSGEPEVEAEDVPAQTLPEGVWTLSTEELESRLEAEYTRGRAEGEANGMTERRKTTRRALIAIAQELVSADTIRTFASGEATPTQFHKVFGDSMERFVVPLAERLGWEVTD